MIPLSFSILSTTAILVIIASLSVMEWIKYARKFLHNSKKQISSDPIGK